MGRLQKKKQIRVKKIVKDKSRAGSLPSTMANNTLVSKKAFATNSFAGVRKKTKNQYQKKELSKRTEPGKFKKKIDQAVQFLREAKIELKKVTWPSQKQTIGSTAFVLLLVFVLSCFLGFVDIGLSSLIKFVLQ